MAVRRQSAATRERVLEAAGREFAQVGFERASLRRIAARAGSALGIINYHFQTKEALYAAVLRMALSEPDPPDGALDALHELPARERLRAFVRLALDDTLAWGASDSGEEGDWRRQLEFREMLWPSPQYLEWFRTEGEAQFAPLTAAVRELLGAEDGALDVDLCVVAILGQVLIYAYERPLLEHLRPEVFADEDARRRLYGYVEDACLAAVEVARARRERGERA